jgi:hypothetical protein
MCRQKFHTNILANIKFNSNKLLVTSQPEVTFPTVKTLRLKFTYGKQMGQKDTSRKQKPFRGFRLPGVRGERRDCRQHIKKRNTPTYRSCQVCSAFHNHYLYPIQFNKSIDSFKPVCLFVKSTFKSGNYL